MNTSKAILMKECGRIERAPVHPRYKHADEVDVDAFLV